ncbi:MAG: DHA2 family efflux MFS transporter permease subunit [Alphaproteobacteria bacterium]
MRKLNPPLAAEGNRCRSPRILGDFKVMNDEPAPITGLARWLITGSVLLAVFIDILDMTIVNVALPHMKGALGATSEQIAWVLTSYMVSAVVVMPLTGYLAARFGRRPVLLFDIAAFVVTSALCGIAQNLEQIVLFRVLQGIAGATLTPLGQSLLLEVFPGKERGKGMAVFAIAAMMAPAMGPTVGGYITEHLSWRWVFFINVPIGLFALLIAFRSLPRDRTRGVHTDWIGLFLMITAVGALQLTLDLGERRGWLTSPFIQATLAATLIGLVAFALRSWNYAGAIVDLSLFRDRNFTSAFLLMLCMGLGFFGSIVLLPLVIQEIMGYSPAATGLVLAPRAAIGLLLMPIVGGALVPRIDPRLLVLVGIFFSAWGCWMMSGYTATMGPWAIAIPGLVQGIGMSFLFVPISTIAFDTLDTARGTDGTGLYNLVRILGGSVGISITASLLSRQSQIHWHTLGGNISDASPRVHDFLDRYPNLSLAALQGELGRQSAMLAFIDLFWLIALSYLALLPFIFIAKPKPRSWNGATGNVAIVAE